METDTPLVSVIIPCFNYGRYLPEALESIFSQNYPNIEIIVVDDGSTDDTRQIVEKYNDVKYVYQINQRLSATRNTGIKHSRGDFIVFLDADDWLLPEAIETNLYHLRQREELAFVSGATKNVFVPSGKVEIVALPMNSDHYYHLLQGCYIGSQSSVMYRRWAFDGFLFEAVWEPAEDYEMWLRIARKFPVQNHTKLISAYRIHSPSMSSDPSLSLSAVLRVLEKQKEFLLDKKESKALNRGKTHVKHHYHLKMYDGLKTKIETGKKFGIFDAIFVYPKLAFLRYLSSRPKLMKSIKIFVKRHSPDFALRTLHILGLFENYHFRVGRIDMGDFDRLSPFCHDFGFTRGGPIDRFYIERFLDEESESIRGRVLEIGDNHYSLRFGGSKLTKSDILHVNEGTTSATIIGDLSNAPHIPSDTFDCIILTQTLQLIYQCKDALATCYRILKPGGTLLMTVPGISQIDEGEWNQNWYWSFTKLCITKLLSESFPSGSFQVKTYGNVLTAAAFLYGMGLPEMNRKQMELTDQHYQVIITAAAVKPGEVDLGVA